MTDLNGTTKFSPVVEGGSDAGTILNHVYRALQAKGYDPVTQLVGYLISGDPTYITSYGQARSMICRLERDEIMEELVRVYLQELDGKVKGLCVGFHHFLIGQCSVVKFGYGKQENIFSLFHIHVGVTPNTTVIQNHQHIGAVGSGIDPFFIGSFGTYTGNKITKSIFPVAQRALASSTRCCCPPLSSR